MDNSVFNVKIMPDDGVRIGRFHLLEPSVFKPTEGEDKEKKEEERPAKPTYDADIALDKKTQKPLIQRLLKAQKAAIQRAIDLEEWDEDSSASLAIKDADKAKVPISFGSTKKILLAKKRPALIGKYSFKAKSNYAPDVRYIIEEKGLGGRAIKRFAPMPRIEPGMSEDEKNEIRAFWEQKIFPGQYVSMTLEVTHWVGPAAQGTRVRLKNILILGGGMPLGMTRFEDDFGDEDLNDAISWLHRNAPAYRIPRNDPWNHTGNEEEDADSETGVIEETPAPRRTLKPVPTEEPNSDGFEDDEESVKPLPKRRRVKPVEPEEDETDYEDEEPVKPRSRRRPVNPAPVDEPDEDDFANYGGYEDDEEPLA